MKDVQRICNKADVVKAYGSTDWAGLNPAIKDVLVDLRFRGDYTGPKRRIIQKHVVKNDLRAFAAPLSNKKIWKRVPKDRFNRRVAYLQAALKKSESYPIKGPGVMNSNVTLAASLIVLALFVLSCDSSSVVLCKRLDQSRKEISFFPRDR